METKNAPARSDRLGLRAEAIRKTIHVSSIALPLAVLLLPPPIPLVLLAAGAIGAVATEWARFRLRWARYAFLKRTRRLLRGRERESYAGATYMAMAYLLAYLLFPVPVAVTAMFYNGLGDATAALVGKRWGRHRLRSGKSWEGFAAGAAVNSAVGIAMPGIPPTVAVAGGIAAAAVELLPIPVDDNLTVTLAGGGLLFLALVVMVG